MTEKWIDICGVDELPEEDVKGVQAEGRDVAVYQVGGEIFATDGVCSHGKAMLCDGFLDGHEIECPLHQGRFDVRNGKAMCAPLTSDIRTYVIKKENGRILLQL